MQNMNPYAEQRLRDEVIYLHSLWHQGPPPPLNPLPIPVQTQKPHNIASASASQPYIPQPLGSYFPGPRWHLLHHHQQHTINPLPVPTHPFVPSHTRSLPPITASPTASKKRKNKNNNKEKSKKHKRDTTNKVTQPDPPQSLGPEWPCPVSPDPPETGWPSLKPRSAPPAVSPQEKEGLCALQAQHKACQAFREFLFDDDDDEEDDDDDDDDDVGDDGCEEFEEFFVRIFMEDDELRGYYQRCFESGEFCCLVCGAIGKKKSGKKFKDCVGLVQHSMSILRTVKKRAHRAFGQAVCRVLGWDIDRIPTIVMKGVPLRCSEGMKPAKEEGDPKENDNDDGKDGSHKSDDRVVSLENNDEPVKEHAQGVDQSISECSSKEGDLDDKAENRDEKMLDIGLKNGGGRAIDEGEPKEKVDDDGKDGPHESDDKVVSLEYGHEPVEEHAQGADRSINECSSKEGDLKLINNAENLDEKMLDIRLENGGGGAVDEVSHEYLVSGAEWGCKNPKFDFSSAASVWTSFSTKSSSQTCSLSAEEQASVSVLQMQHKALGACQEYLVGNAGSDCDDDSDDEDEDELIDDSDLEECEEYKFFLKLFMEDTDLRRYYENYREGDFYCLVCGGVGKKIWKRFKDCIALLQHSAAIKRTKRKRAHRAYSQVICKILGWDVDRLPAIVLKGESLGSSLAGSRKISGEP